MCTESLNLSSQRKNWVDWMKVISMFFIVWGHTFPASMENFIYAFNVPVFFVISGFLCKRESSLRELLSKNWYSLIVPYLIICVIKRGGFWLKEGFSENTLLSVWGVFTGFHSIGDVPGCTMLWFIPTLLIIKIVFQLCAKNKTLIIILSFVSILFAVIYANNRHDYWAWGVTNVPLAIPFFLFGHICSNQLKFLFDKFCAQIKRQDSWLVVSCIIILFILIYWISKDNPERLNMYKGYYEGSIITTYMLGFLGTFAILLCSLLLDHIHLKGIYTLSVGTLLILGFHRDIAHPLEKPFLHFDSGTIAYDGSMFLISIIVMLIFIPIINMAGKYIPFLLGRRLK